MIADFYLFIIIFFLLLYFFYILFVHIVERASGHLLKKSTLSLEYTLKNSNVQARRVCKRQLFSASCTLALSN